MIATGQTLKSSEVDVKGRSLWVDARRRLLKNRAAMAGLIILALVALLALLAPLLSSFAYDEVNYDIIACAPNWWPADACHAPGHVFGTDSVGRDLFVRVLYGARTSLIVAVVATGLSMVIGVVALLTWWVVR